jgi:hypothetical protein
VISSGGIFFYPRDVSLRSHSSVSHSVSQSFILTTLPRWGGIKNTAQSRGSVRVSERRRARHALSNIQPRRSFGFARAADTLRIPGEINFASRCRESFGVAPLKKAALRVFKDEFELLCAATTCVCQRYTLRCVGNSGKGAHSFISFPLCSSLCAHVVKKK